MCSIPLLFHSREHDGNTGSTLNSFKVKNTFQSLPKNEKGNIKEDRKKKAANTY